MQDMFYEKQRGLVIASHKILYCGFLVFEMLLICPFKNKQKEQCFSDLVLSFHI